MVAENKIDQAKILSLLFPASVEALPPCPAGAEDISFSPDAKENGKGRFYCTDVTAPTIIYYPAGDGSAASFDMLASQYCQRGMNVFLAAYSGCGVTDGSTSVTAMYADSRKIFTSAANWLHQKGCNGPLFVMGRSLGSLCAIDTVAENGQAVKGMIIESGIFGTASFLRALGVREDLAEIKEEEGFNNSRKIAEIKVPTLIFHGAKDQLVPVVEAEKLQAASGARNKQFFVIPGADHFTVGQTAGDLFIEAIKQFIDTVCGVNTWRHRRRSYKRT